MVGPGKLVHQAPDQANLGVQGDSRGHQPRKEVPIHRQGVARGDPRLVRALDDERLASAQLGLQQAGGGRQVVAAQGIRTHQFGEQRRGVGRRKTGRLHLDEGHRDAALGQLPGRLAARQAPADDSYSFVKCKRGSHGRSIGQFPATPSALRDQFTATPLRASRPNSDDSG